MKTQRIKVSLALILLGLSLSTQLVYAAHKSDVIVNGQILFSIGSTSTLDASERAALVNSRLQGLVERGRGITPVKARQVGDHWEIYSGDLVLITVTEKDADDFETTQEKLAQDWAARLDHALSQVRELKKQPVLVDSTRVFMLGSTEAAQAAERAAMVNTRVRQIIRQQEDVPIKGEVREGLHVITAGGPVLLTVTQEDALTNNTSTDELAKRWAAVLREEVNKAKEERTANYLTYAAKKAVAALFILLLCLWLLWKIYRIFHDRLQAIRQRRALQDKVEFGWLAATQTLLYWLLWLSRVVLVGTYAHYVLRLTPYTRRPVDEIIIVLEEIVGRLVSVFTTPLFSLGGTQISLKTVFLTLLFIILVLVLARATRRFLNEKLLSRTHMDLGLRHAVSTAFSYLIILLGFVIGLQAAGINLSALAVIAGAVGIGIGFGLQNIANNFISGVIILIERPIQIGDRVQVGDIIGTVVRISARSSTILSNDNIAIIVPNSEFISSRVINWSHHGDRRVRFRIKISVDYNSDLRAVEKALLEAASEHKDVLPHPPPSVRFMSFGDSGLNFELRVWTAKLLDRPGLMTSDMNFAIFEKLKKYGIEIPRPQRDLHLRSAVPIEARIEQVNTLVLQEKNEESGEEVLKGPDKKR